MTDLLVYATEPRADAARQLLGAACRASGVTARLEVYGSSGSLYQRLGPRHSPPAPDVVMWFGPFAARAATLDGLLQPYQPQHRPVTAMDDPGGGWTILDYSTVGAIGTPPVQNFADLNKVPRLAIADPERSEVGLSILLLSLDRARQAEADAERGWNFWVERARAGLLLAEDEAGAVAMVEAGIASHALTLARQAPALVGLAPIPHAISLPSSSRNVDAARRLLDWLTSEAAGSMLSMSPWQADSNGLAALLRAAPALDIEWARQEYTAARRRWAQSAFGPILGG